MSHFKVIVLFVGAIFLLVACGSSAPPEPVEITILMSEYAYSPVDLTFEIGQEVTINLVNEGELDHELMIGRTVSSVDGQPNGFFTDFFEAAGIEPEVKMAEGEHEEGEHAEGEHEEGEHAEGEHEEGDHNEEAEHDEGDHDDDGGHEHSGYMVMVPPSTNMVHSITFTVTPEMGGDWEIGCFLDDGAHYINGMVGTVSVVR